MIAAVDAWGELMKAALGMVQTGLRTNEMMIASHSVINSRVGTMAAAARNPWGGDYVELGRMIPEKVSAFSEAGSALVKHWSDMLVQTSEQLDQLRSMWMAGRLPSVGEVSDFASRATAHAASVLTTTMNAGSVALLPIHERATANARRLSARA